MLRCLSLSLFTSFFFSTEIRAVDVKNLDETHEREIAAAAKTEVAGKFSEADFLKCVPQESKAYPKVWSEELQEKVFGDGALKALMKCTQKDCAFNFSREELAQLEKAASADERKKLYISFYENRALGETELNPDHAPFLIRSNHKITGGCADNRMRELLDSRPASKLPRRLSHIRYNPKMRQTTRLLQSTHFSLKNNAGYCFAEALIFSDHYDLDRVEVWKLEKSGDDKYELSVEVRHRLDFLNSWVRRLNKRALTKELMDNLDLQMQAAETCLKAKPRPFEKK